MLEQARCILTEKIGQTLVLDKLDPISLGPDRMAVFKEGNIVIKLCSTL